jgi:outer membrane receptor protein involved in Fe transport
MRNFCRTLTMSILAALLAVGTLTFAEADARSTSYDLNIPSEDLTAALQSFAIASHHKLLYKAELTAGKTSRALKGHFTAQEAMEALLSGTGLSYEITGSSVVLIKNQADAKTTDVREESPSDGGPPVRLAQASPATSTGSSSTATENQNGSQKDSDASPSTDKEHDSKLEEIVVTGTNISGVENKTVPLLTFDRDAIERSGYATTADFITSLPQNVKSGSNSPDGALAPGLGLLNIDNSTAANLRGLGANSTLTLLNGHRVAPSAYGSGVDLSMIPLSAVERIEVLTDGSSAVYGSDAVGGVVNIILRKDFNGAETSARLDTLARGGGELKQIGQSLGKTWGSGGALAVFEFQDADAIRSDQRSFTGNLPRPTDVFPASKRYSGTLTAHQSLGASFELFADALIEHNDGLRAVTVGGFTTQTQITTSKTNSDSANAGFRWQPFGDWHLEGDALFSQVDTLTTTVYNPPNFGYINGTPELRNLDTIEEADLKLDGTLWSSGGSSLKAALGASYRQEDFSSLIEYANLDRPADRHIHAAFAEFYAPLVTAANALPGVRKLDLSAAVRDDSYSDFGSKINPRFGVFWSPIDQIGLRAAYSTSFRAPNPVEIISTVTDTSVYVESGFPQPQDPSGDTGVIFFGNQVLGPETSRNLTAGLDFTPTALPTTRFSLNYYRIIYSNRIITSPIAADIFVNPQIYGPLIQRFPNDAAVAAFVAGLEPPQTLVDLTPNHTGLTGVRFGFPYGDINAAKESTQGLDLVAHSILNLDAANKLILDFNATYIKDIETNFCDSCAGTDLVDTYGQPLKLRLRASTGWSDGIFSTNAAVNYANAYSDTNLTPPGRIAAFTTVDLTASWHIRASGTTLAFNIINALNSGPPLTGPGLNNVKYDPINADPRGRTLSFQVRQAW